MTTRMRNQYLLSQRIHGLYGLSAVSICDAAAVAVAAADDDTTGASRRISGRRWRIYGWRERSQILLLVVLVLEEEEVQSGCDDGVPFGFLSSAAATTGRNMTPPTVKG